MQTVSIAPAARRREMGTMRARRLARLARRRRLARRNPLSGWVVVLLAAIAFTGFAGFGGVAGTSVGVAKVAFFVLLAGFAACVVHGLARSMHRPVSRL